jgi:DNA-binding PadR family transcriptional regulator
MSANNPTGHIGTSTPLNATAASILGLLAKRPMSGWELFAAFESSIGQFWSITRSQIYRELQTLGANGLIEIGATGARERRLCTITARGREMFAAWIAGMPGDELIRFPLLLTTFFGDAVPLERLWTICAEHRGKHAAQLAAYEAQYPEAAANEPFPSQALAFGIAYERTVLAWIDGLPWMNARSGAIEPTRPQKV